VKYQLRMNISIRAVDDHGGYYGGSDQLQVTDDINFEAASFLEIAHVLGQFHELGQKVKKAQ